MYYWSNRKTLWKYAYNICIYLLHVCTSTWLLRTIKQLFMKNKLIKRIYSKFTVVACTYTLRKHNVFSSSKIQWSQRATSTFATPFPQQVWRWRLLFSDPILHLPGVPLPVISSHFLINLTENRSKGVSISMSTSMFTHIDDNVHF